MSLIDGIEELRHLMSEPKDPLFGQLTDLIVALNEASGSCEKDVSLRSKNKLKRTKKCRDKLESCLREAPDSGDKSGKRTEVCGTLDLTDSEKELSAHNAGSCFNPKHLGDDFANNTCKSTWHVSVSQQDTTMIKLKFFQRPTGLPVESDSFTENLTPARRNRRKRLIKRMAVDVTENAGGCNIVDGGGIMSMDVENGGKMSTYRQNLSRTRQFPSSCSGTYFLTPKQRVRGFSSTCNSESSMDCDFCFSGTSESVSEGHITSDEEGHQGDDEQSDWYFELPHYSNERNKICANNACSSSTERPMNGNRGTRSVDDCVMGIPNIKKIMMRKLSKEQAIGLNHYIQTMESSDTDISQSSSSLRCSTKIFGKRLLTKNIPSMTSALNKRIINFLQSPTDSELQLGMLKRRERKEALRLASFYNLDVCCTTSNYAQMYTFIKTKYTINT